MELDDLKTRWQRVLDAVEELGGEASALDVGPAADAQELRQAEQDLGAPLPPKLRRFLAEFSESLEFDWRLPGGYRLPAPLDEVYFGGCELSLDGVVEAETAKRAWLEEVIRTWEIPEAEAAWENKFGFMTLANGDIVAVDLDPAKSEAVVYLSHDGEEAGEEILGDDIFDFMAIWSRLGCPGPEWWQWEPFLDSNDKLSAEVPAALKWRAVVGLLD